MKKSLLQLIGLLVVLTGGVFFAQEALASNGGPACNLQSNPSEIIVGEGITLVWWSTGDVIEARLYPKGSNHLITTFTGSRGWWWMAGIIDSRDYTLVVIDTDGGRASCDAHVEAVTSNEEEGNGGVESVDVSNGRIDVVKNYGYSHHKDHKKYKTHKKYRGSANKAIYKKIKNWKKYNNALYIKYKTIYKKYKGTSSEKLKKRLSPTEYAIYSEYKIYHKYKEYRHYKKRAHK